MKKYFLILCLVCVGGCGDFILGSNAVKDSASPVASAASDVLDVIENATGADLISNETAAKGESIANQVGTGANALKAGAKIAAPFLGEYADTATAGAGALSALALAAAAFFRRQAKKAKTESNSVA